MAVIEINKNMWIKDFEVGDLKKRYNDDYKKRDKNYFNNAVPNIRRKYVTDYAELDKCFDFGCGMNPFYDENEIGGQWDKYLDNHSFFDVKKYRNCDTLLAFDVLEHLYDLDDFLNILDKKRIIGTIPIVPFSSLESVEILKGWKHYKIFEHIYYFTENGFFEFFKRCNWKIVYFAKDECPPRKDIANFVAIRT